MEDHEASVPESDEVFLPDDVVLKILEFMPETRDLLSARLVCRRWAGLALHREVWRGRGLSDAWERFAVFKAALHLAPCVGELHVSGDYIPGDNSPTSLKSCGVLAATTRCAAKKLKIVVGDGDAVVAALTLQNQVALGRLREVDVEFGFLGQPTEGRPSVTDRSIELLSAAVSASEGLAALTLTFSNNKCTSALPRRRPEKPSLTKLSCYYQDRGSSAFTTFRFLVDCHAPTLETVHFEAVDNLCPHFRFPGFHPDAYPSAKWLSKASRLRELHCPVQDDMTALLLLPSLETFGLTVRESLEWLADNECRKFLREATRLRKLKLRVKLPSAALDAALLVQDVASSCCSALEVLTLRSPIFRDDESLEVLIAALQRLGALRELRVSVDPSAALRLLDFMSSIPKPMEGNALTLHFEELATVTDNGRDFVCGHSWLHQHEPEITTIFLKNPNLHLFIYGRGVEYLCSMSELSCSTCDLKCHLVRGCPWVIFGHAESHPCSLNHHSDRENLYYRFV